jgi:uncharacterized protein YfeS
VVGTGLRAMVFIAEGRRKKEEGRRKKEEAVIAMVLAVKNVLTVLAVAIDKIRILKSLLDKLSSLSLESKKSVFYVGGF